MEIREKVKQYIPALQKLAERISEIDVLQCFATVSEENNYVRPTFTNTNSVKLVESRHPVVEKVMKEEAFVPNDIQLDEDKFMLLITGPNMSGKSTYMRQLALTIIMAQVGCFVPAKSAQLTIFDQIFTRIGAADDLVSGQSTFMVEMLEAKHAVQHATNNSLILLDEIGRGTSTYDGMAIAQAIIEHIHEYIHAKTLFSTHYHELTSLEEKLNGLRNIHVRAEEINEEVVFLHQIHQGAADESYGIHVAKLAGLPDSLINRANVILEQLENNDSSMTHRSIDSKASDIEQMSFFVEEKPMKQKEKQAESELVNKLKKVKHFRNDTNGSNESIISIAKTGKKRVDSMMKIMELPDFLANKIAAGEVVERPASVVKELVENSVDAKSNWIKVDIEEAGLQTIKVTDDGVGIPADQCKNAFLRHATSKITNENDLFHVKTLGFRGEALASIAAVSRLRIQTSTGEEAGTVLELEGGELQSEGYSDARRGTEITVKDLFF